MPARPPASVIIVVFNGRQYLDDCLSSVISQLQPHDEIILVDNNSTDGSPDFVAHHFPQVNLVRQPQNGGFAQGCAVGVAHSTAALLVFLNQDTHVSPDWLEALLDPLSDQNSGLTTSLILLMSEPDRVHLAGQRLHYSGLVSSRGYRQTAQNCQSPEAVFAVSGASFAIRRALWDQLGGFDSTFWMYYEETDLCWRAALQGYPSLIIPNSIVYHDHQPGPRGCDQSYYTFRNRYLLLLKNFRYRTLCLLLPALFLAESLDWVIALRFGWSGLRAKTNANLWLIAHCKQLNHSHQHVRSSRQRSDYSILSLLDAALVLYHLPFGKVGRFLLTAVNTIFRLNYRLALVLYRRFAW